MFCCAREERERLTPGAIHIIVASRLSLMCTNQGAPLPPLVDNCSHSIILQKFVLHFFQLSLGEPIDTIQYSETPRSVPGAKRCPPPPPPQPPTSARTPIPCSRRNSDFERILRNPRNAPPLRQLSIYVIRPHHRTFAQESSHVPNTHRG